MKRFLLLALPLLLLATSCSKNGAGYADLIIGRWVLERTELDGKAEATPVQSLSFTESTMTVYYDTGDEVGSYPQSYYIDERDKTIRGQYGTVIFKILKLTSIKLNLEEPAKEGVIKAYFTRKTQR